MRAVLRLVLARSNATCSSSCSCASLPRAIRRRTRTHDEAAASSPSLSSSSTPFGTVASNRPRSSVSNPPALAATAAAVSSARRLGWRERRRPRFVVRVSTSAVASVRHPPRGARDRRAPSARKNCRASRRRVRRRSRSRALAVRFPVRSRLRSRLCFRRRRRAEKFRDASVCRGVVAESDAGGVPRARARHRRLSLRVEHGDGGVGDGIGRLPRRVDRFSTFGVGDAMASAPSLKSRRVRPVFQSKSRRGSARRRSRRVWETRSFCFASPSVVPRVPLSSLAGASF